MTPRRILVTGADGFVGRHLAPALARAFPDAVVVASGFDVTDPAAVQRGVAEAGPDALVHLAGIAAPAQARQDQALAWQVNLHGALAVAQAVLAEAPNCTLLHISSADAYGASFKAGRSLDETAPLAPQNAYGATKAAADLALGAMAADGLRLVRARPFNHTGPGQTEDFVVPAFARQVARIEAGLQPPVLNVGALDAARDFLDVRDVCDAYAAILSRCEALAPGAIVNIASGVPRRIGDVLQALLETAGVAAEVQTSAGLLRPSDIPVACGDAGLARSVLGWSPGIPWEQTLADVLADWRDRIRPG